MTHRSIPDLLDTYPKVMELIDYLGATANSPEAGYIRDWVRDASKTLQHSSDLLGRSAKALEDMVASRKELVERLEAVEKFMNG